MGLIVCIIGLSVIGYLGFRYGMLLLALKAIERELNDIRQDLTQPQILHLPSPNRHIQPLLSSFNATLEDIRKERQMYEKREKEFQRQIENISHDLRTPLTVILGYSKLMKKSEQYCLMDPELIEPMELIEQKAETMKDLVTQFYDFSRLHAGDYAAVMQSVDVCRAMRESLMGNYQGLEQSHLQINAKIPEHPLWVLADPAALDRIFLNLFQNAGRYAKSYLDLSIKEEADHVMLTFCNDAESLSETAVDRLFDRFYMLDKARTQGGTGLGLTVAKSLAEEMGATLTAALLEQDTSYGKQKETAICFTLQMKLMLPPIV